MTTTRDFNDLYSMFRKLDLPETDNQTTVLARTILNMTTAQLSMFAKQIKRINHENLMEMEA
jgi:hypothetical protein